MKTYTEVEGSVPFDWYEALNRDIITEDEWEDLEKLARSWVTCACGVQCAIIPRDGDGVPIDSELKNLGGDYGFFGAIKNHNQQDALHYLKQIEERSEKLIIQYKSYL